MFNTEERIAPFFVILNGLILGGLVWLPYSLLISSSMVIGNLSLFLLYVGYIKLKRREPNAAWLYNINWIAAGILTILPFAFTGFMTYYAVFEYPITLGIPYINLVSTVAVVGTGLLVHGCVALYKRKRTVGDYFDEDDEDSVNSEADENTALLN